MPRHPYKTTKNYARRLHNLSKRIINERYEGHNAMTVVDRMIGQLEQKLTQIDERAAMTAHRAKKAKAAAKIKVAEPLPEDDDVVVIEAEAERTESAEGDSAEGAAAALP